MRGGITSLARGGGVEGVDRRDRPGSKGVLESQCSTYLQFHELPASVSSILRVLSAKPPNRRLRTLVEVLVRYG